MKIIDRIKGMDVSTLVEEEQHGACYYDNGVREDLFTILKRYGVNSIRLRLWNNPYSPKGEPYGAGTNDFDRTVLLAQRSKAAGMSWLLDFHYSDFWADPGKQYPPKAWTGLEPAELVRAVHDYTYEILDKLKKLDLMPFMVQVGNELTGGCLWPYGRRDYVPEGFTGGEPYFNPILKDIIEAGIRAVREVSKDIIVMLHLDNGGNNDLYRSWFDGFYACGETKEDFDVIGLSYYPFWHGTLAALESNMKDIAARYKKELVIAEVSMGHSMEDYRRYENTRGSAEELKGMATKEELTKNLDYPMTPDGQRRFMEHLGRIISSIDGNLCRGYYYWEPAWIPVPGCGWATDASLAYIRDKGPCGNEWANQALFDYDGNALEGLKVSLEPGGRS